MVIPARRRRRIRGPIVRSLACPNCLYDLNGLPPNHHCPECGYAYADLPIVWNWNARPSFLVPIGLAWACVTTTLYLLQELTRLPTVFSKEKLLVFVFQGAALVALGLLTRNHRGVVAILTDGLVVGRAGRTKAPRPWTDFWMPPQDVRWAATPWSPRAAGLRRLLYGHFLVEHVLLLPPRWRWFGDTIVRIPRPHDRAARRQMYETIYEHWRTRTRPEWQC